ncbi:class I SAM-dependent methyltransferase [Bordetella bronchiseptica]|uniref:class I SAM-dependent methyltransferase n=1 Tax=Bordetella bronchiseptica TaxID=518 RepID=UPI00046207BA|nr:class I SAM-dependent methyltransferase [Bordetella bronchiseptica]KDB66091.1 hypothetical protein AZ21_2941 [Bordetella bronchiseptica B20-10725633]KDB82119.1 hypothetical protein L495_2748 [Bordetella bronchiseptica CARE970018BB]KDC48369.1 hypothetical protein L509_2800 [Bordetella bronchiseptica M85/00/2]KDC58113.1 hypothetical protein L511_2789 [Bordetella bronchiseptica MBORD595]KDC65972.1 hypothetical protein L512_2821 [Bordetella bronchiseptica MBORD624]
MLGWLKKGRYAAKRLLFRISPAWAARRGVAFTLQAPSRQFLEAEVFSYINARAASLAHPAACLFIGVDKHNWHYPRLLSPAFHSIDCDPAHAVYGQPGLHVVGSALELDRHYRSAMFDFVIANGLLGFGVDTRGDCDRLLAQAHGVLAPGGLLVLGYNDTPERVPFRVEDTDGHALFEPHVPAIDGVHGCTHTVPDEFRHRYLFLRRPRN